VRQCVGEDQTWEKTEEECVEAVWEKRRMREKRLDQQLGQRFLMGAGNQILALLGFVLGVQRQALRVQGYAVKKHSNSYILPWTIMEIKLILGVQIRFLEV